jgi:cobalt-zinc-cadmium efflux system outer membrane protein
MRRLCMSLILATLFHVPTFAQNGAGAPPATGGLPQPPTAAAQTTVPAVTLARAIEMALQDHPELSVARREIEASEAARQQAAAWPNPQLGFELEDTRRETRSTTFLLSQSIELGGKRAARMAAADRERDIATVQAVARRAQVRAAVTGAYFDALIAQERVRLAESAMQVAQSGTSAASRRVTAGKVAPVEETRARLAESSVRIELAQARSDLQGALYELGAAVGRAEPAIERVDGTAQTLPAVPEPSELERQLAASPALRLVQLETDRQAALVDVERARGVPDLTVSVGQKRSEELGRNQALIGLSIPLPLFDRNQGSVRQALRRQDKARDEAQAVALRLRADVLRARERLSAASIETHTLQREIVPGAEEAYAAATKGFELGKFSYLEALDAQRTLLQARSQYLRALAQAHRARIDLDRLLSVDDPLTASLAR